MVFGIISSTSHHGFIRYRRYFAQISVPASVFGCYAESSVTLSGRVTLTTSIFLIGLDSMLFSKSYLRPSLVSEPNIRCVSPSKTVSLVFIAGIEPCDLLLLKGSILEPVILNLAMALVARKLERDSAACFAISWYG